MRAFRKLSDEPGLLNDIFGISNYQSIGRVQDFRPFGEGRRPSRREDAYEFRTNPVGYHGIIKVTEDNDGRGNDPILLVSQSETGKKDSIVVGSQEENDFRGRDEFDIPVISDVANYFKEGNDRFFGEGNDDIIRGKFGDDVLSGGEGNDILYGYGHQFPEPLPVDAIIDKDNDILMGNGGTDELTGGPKADIFVFSRSDASSTIEEADWGSNLSRKTVCV